MSRTHALLSPSSGERWMACTPSARLLEGITTESTYADEGTLAHDLGELLVKDKFNLITPKIFASTLTKIQRNQYYNKAMFDHCCNYATFVLEAFNTLQAKDKEVPKIVIEAEIDYSFYVPEGKGYVDILIYTSKTIQVIDLKYGAGVPVSSQNNTQLKLYALGGLEILVFVDHNIQQVYLSIFQPRIDNNSTFLLTTEELIAWAEQVVKPAAKLAWEGAGELIPGNHCRFCGIKAKCRAFANKNMEIAKQRFKEPHTLDDDEIIALYGDFDAVSSWIKAVEAHIMAEALKGRKWPGFKLVRGRSNRKYVSEEEVKAHLLGKSFDEKDITRSSLLPITEMEKYLGGSIFKKLLGHLVIKPPGAPTLVPVDDPRIEIKDAAAVFEDDPEYFG